MPDAPRRATRPGMILSCLILSLGLAVIPSVGQAREGLGERREPGELRAGGLLLRAADGLREAPTLETEVEIDVSGMITRVHVVQRFENPTPDWVEGVYVFPLPEGASVDGLEIRSGLELDDPVVVAGIRFVQPGMTVRTMNP